MLALQQRSSTGKDGKPETKTIHVISNLKTKIVTQQPQQTTLKTQNEQTSHLFVHNHQPNQQDDWYINAENTPYARFEAV